MKIELRHAALNHIVLSCRGLNLCILWKCESPNTLNDSVLSVEGYKTKFDNDGHQLFMDNE